MGEISRACASHPPPPPHIMHDILYCTAFVTQAVAVVVLLFIPKKESGKSGVWELILYLYYAKDHHHIRDSPKRSNAFFPRFSVFASIGSFVRAKRTLSSLKRNNEVNHVVKTVVDIENSDSTEISSNTFSGENGHFV